MCVIASEDRIEQQTSFRSQLVIVLGSLAAIAFCVRFAHPHYVAEVSLGSQLAEHRYVDSAEIRAPWLHATAELALQTPQFLLDRERFAMDLLRTGHVNQARARSLADVAVREAYMRRIPPALVLGVMLTENTELNSEAQSHVGAVGLMQVSPKHWRDALGGKFGTNIHADSTNLKYGIYILGWVAERAASLLGDRNDAWRGALLRYNGCVNVVSTHSCFNYPESVRRQVEQAGKSTCPEGNFDRCVVQPMWLARGEPNHVDAAAAAAAAAAATAAAGVGQDR